MKIGSLPTVVYQQALDSASKSLSELLRKYQEPLAELNHLLQEQSKGTAKLIKSLQNAIPNTFGVAVPEK